MTDENIKEALGLRFIEVLANYKGFKTNTSYPDYGTDLEIIEVDFRIENDHKRYCDTGRELKIQLKSTTENSIIQDTSVLKYDLEIKTYNDLISRKNNLRPLLLVLFILPDNPDSWLLLTVDELLIRKQAYWFYPESLQKTDNTSTIRICIPKTNLFSTETIDELFENFA